MKRSSRKRAPAGPVRRSVREAGFTLIEVLLALAIFTIIGIATAKHIQQIRNTKESAFNDLELYSSVRATIAMIRIDLSQAFHVPYEDLGEEAKAAVIQNVAVPHTLFDGRKNQMIFTSLSHRAYYAARRESEQTEVSYFLQERKGFNNPSLMKRESSFIDENLYEGGSIYTLLDNVTQFEIAYWDDKTGRWVDDWSSDDGQYRDRFPMAVRLKLSAEDNHNKRVALETEFKVAFPNNSAFLVQF
jgi:general secretion pathway protein J